MKEKNDKIDDIEKDPVRLGESGWKSRYYSSKMGATPETQESVARAMVAEYVRGLIWVCRYYYEVRRK